MTGAQATVNEIMSTELSILTRIRKTEALKSLKGIIFRYLQFC